MLRWYTTEEEPREWKMDRRWIEERKKEPEKEPREWTREWKEKWTEQWNKRRKKGMDRRIAKPHGTGRLTSHYLYSYTLLGRPIIIFRKFR